MRSKEHSIQHIKPELKLMRKTLSYLMQKLVNLRKKEAFKLITEQFNASLEELATANSSAFDLVSMVNGGIIGEDENGDNEKGDDDDNIEDDDDGNNIFLEEMGKTLSQDWFSAYYRYESIDEIKIRLKSGEAICGFFLDEDSNCASEADQLSICVAFGKERDNVKYVRLVCQNQIRCDKHCGLLYCKFVLEDGAGYIKSKRDIRKKMKGCCIMLPSRANQVSFHQQFTVITHDWKTIVKDYDSNGELRFNIGAPMLDLELFRTL